MAYSLSAGFLAAVQSDGLHPIVLAEFQFSSGTVNFWTGLGSLNWDSKTWTGTGYLGGFSTVEESTDSKATGVRFTLSGLPVSVLAIAFDQQYQGRSAKTWFGVMDDNNRLIADPIQIFSGLMDTMELSEDGETSTVTLAVENELIDLERPRVFRYTPEDQNEYFSGDTFFDYVAALQNAQIIWGKASSLNSLQPRGAAT